MEVESYTEGASEIFTKRTKTRQKTQLVQRPVKIPPSTYTATKRKILDPQDGGHIEGGGIRGKDKINFG